MALFSERAGIRTCSIGDSIEDFDRASRVGLWNLLHTTRESVHSRRGYGENPTETWTTAVWAGLWDLPLDTHSIPTAWNRMRELVMSGAWSDVLDLLEFSIKAGDRIHPGLRPQFAEAFNLAFERYMIGYRFVENEIIAVTDAEEIKSIERAIVDSTTSARTHLNRAVELLGNRGAPQYAKVVSESVSAVESTIAELTGERVLSDGLKVLESKGLPAHPAIVQAWNKLYGYTSDAGGIRHGLIRNEDVDEPLAVYFLVSCSAFINMLLKLAAR